MPENLLGKEGCKFKAKISGDPVTGEIHIEDGKVYLLQDSKVGSRCHATMGYKYSYTVHSGSKEALESEGVREFELVDDRTIKFSDGAIVKVKSDVGIFRYGGDKTIIPCIYGKIKSHMDYDDVYKSNKVHVAWYPKFDCTYSMLEKELELSSETEASPRDIPGIQKFKVGDLIRVKAGIKEFIFGGAARGTSGDYGKVTSTGGFNHDKKCMTVFVKFNDSRNYTMSEDELEFAPEVPTREIHTFVKGDVIKWHDTLWYVTDADCSGIIVESESGQKNTFLTADQKELEFVKSFRPELINIRCGMYLKVEKLVNWSMNADVHCPVGNVKSGDIIRVFDVGNLKCIATGPYRPFLFEFNEKKWGGCLSAENRYSISSSSFYKLPPSAHLAAKPYVEAIHAGLGIMDRIEYPGLHISPVASPDWVNTGMPDPRAEAYAREMYYYREREAAKKRAMEESYRYGGRPSYPGWINHSEAMHMGMMIPPDEVWEKRLVDPRKEREKYISGVDPFDKPPAPTKDLEIKKQKKFSL